MTLVEITTERKDGENPNHVLVISNETNYIYKRDSCATLLDYIFSNNIKCAVWTHEKQKVARNILRNVFKEYYSRLYFVKTQRSCDVSNEMYVKNLNKVQGNVILYDFSEEQVYFNINNNCKQSYYFDDHAKLSKFKSFLVKNHKCFYTMPVLKKNKKQRHKKPTKIQVDKVTV